MINFFDTETTGTDPVNDRIVQLAVSKYTDDLQTLVSKKCVLINPERPIPAAATAVHHITDDMVKDKPTFKMYSKSMLEYFDGCDVAGYNIDRFDIPLLSEEFGRAGLSWPHSGMRVLDACTIFKKKEERTLTAALRFYCGSLHTEAHDAEADNDATRDVLIEQLRRYEDLGAMSLDELHKFCAGDQNRVDLAGKIILDERGLPCYSFGKHKGEPVTAHPGFAQWMLRENFSTDTKKHLTRILNQRK
jgi:DNA polymerase III subunit epsilon